MLALEPKMYSRPVMSPPRQRAVSGEPDPSSCRIGFPYADAQATIAEQWRQMSRSRVLRTKAKSVGRLFAEGGWTELWRLLQRRLYSESRFFVLRCDLTVHCGHPAPAIPVTVRPLRSSDTATLLNLDEPGIGAKGISHRLHQQRLLDIGLMTCYVAVTADDHPCYMTWLVPPSENAIIATYFGDAVLPLAADEMLVEGVFTLEAYRRRRIMEAAGVQLRTRAVELGARWLVAYVDQENVPSLKGFRRNGYIPDLVRRERWRLFRRQVTFTALPAGWSDHPLPGTLTPTGWEGLSKPSGMVCSNGISEPTCTTGRARARRRTSASASGRRSLTVVESGSESGASQIRPTWLGDSPPVGTVGQRTDCHRGSTVLSVQAQQVIDRPPSEVFAYVARDHFQNHAQWDPNVIELVQTSAGPMSDGTTARLIRQDGKRRSEGTMEVVEYDPEQRFATISRFGPFVLHTHVRFEPAGQGRTLTVLTIDTEAHGFMRVLLPLMRRTFAGTMQRSLRTIKDAVEARSPASN